MKNFSLSELCEYAKYLNTKHILLAIDTKNDAFDDFLGLKEYYSSDEKGKKKYIRAAVKKILKYCNNLNDSEKFEVLNCMLDNAMYFKKQHIEFLLSYKTDWDSIDDEFLHTMLDSLSYISYSENSDEFEIASKKLTESFDKQGTLIANIIIHRNAQEGNNSQE